MSRTTKGWLTASELRGGAREQYAVQRKYGRVLIELSHRKQGREPWVVTLTIHEEPGGEVTGFLFLRLADARQKFKQLVRKHP